MVAKAAATFSAHKDQPYHWQELIKSRAEQNLEGRNQRNEIKYTNIHIVYLNLTAKNKLCNESSSNGGIRN